MVPIRARTGRLPIETALVPTELLAEVRIPEIQA
jgi:hypothetical protein